MPRAAALLLLGLWLALPALAQDAREIARDMEYSVGRVLTLDAARRPRGSGSGYVVSIGEDGAPNFLTNRHVIENARGIVVVFGTEAGVMVFEGRLLNASAEYDMAVLSLSPVDGHDFRPVPLPLAAMKMEQGDDVYAIGFPGTADLMSGGIDDPAFYDTVLTRGVLGKRTRSAWTADGGRVEILQHDAALNPGNSGGPLLSRCGTVAGLNTAGSARPGASGTFWSSSAEAISAFLDASGIDGVTSQSCGLGLDWRMTAGGLLLAAAVLIGSIALRSGGGGSPIPLPRLVPGRKQVLAVEIGGLQHSFHAGELSSGVVIGRGDEAGVKVASDALSRRHAQLLLRDRKLFIRDLGSTNGTEVDGRALQRDESVQINTRSALRLGGLEMRLTRSGAA